VSEKNTVWLEALRLRTLPLAASCVLVGSGMAYYKGVFDPSIALLTLLTTLLLQILSNLANDYGDGVKGTDDHRIGPQRGVQSGVISAKEMKSAVIITAILTFLCGFGLLWLAIPSFNLTFLLFLVLGILSIAAAIKYTVGKGSYGYYAMGDVFVLVFFGWIGVMGTYYLQNPIFWWPSILPATMVGLLSVGVLNVNNMRDIETDANAGKRTVAVLLGKKKAKQYHISLLVLSILCLIAFIRVTAIENFEVVMIVGILLCYVHGKKVLAAEEPGDLNPLLKQLALSTFGLSLFFCAMLVITQ